MKKILFYVILGCTAFNFTQCNSSASLSDQQKETTFGNYQNLGDFLRTQSGVIVKGFGDNTQVLIRGLNTIELGTEPMYIIDGQIMGNNYTRANNAVDPNNISSVRVLKSKTETVIYGTQGVNGVILIKTKLNN